MSSSSMKVTANWAAEHIAQLAMGRVVEFRPRGGSMRGRVEDGQLCRVAPLGSTEPKTGDIVLVDVRGRTYLHLIKSIRLTDLGPPEYLIGNNRGRVNGWVGVDSIHGILIEALP